MGRIFGAGAGIGVGEHGGGDVALGGQEDVPWDSWRLFSIEYISHNSSKVMSGRGAGSCGSQCEFKSVEGLEVCWRSQRSIKD